MLAEKVGGIFADQNPLIQMYEAMEKMQALGQELPADAYVQFLIAASPKAEKLGTYNRLVQAVAGEYAAEKASPAAMLKEIASGTFDERARVREEKFAHKAPVGAHTAKVLEGRAPAAQMIEQTKMTEIPAITNAMPGAKITHMAEAMRLEEPKVRKEGKG
jgi:hypothetical protein